MTTHTSKILRFSHRKIFKVCLVIFQHYERKGYHSKINFLNPLTPGVYYNAINIYTNNVMQNNPECIWGFSAKYLSYTNHLKNSAYACLPIYKFDKIP